MRLSTADMAVPDQTSAQIGGYLKPVSMKPRSDGGSAS